MSLPIRDLLSRLPCGLLGMLVLIVASEGYIERNDLKFSRIEPEDWKAAARVANQELPPGGVLLFGDSQMKFGISPLTIESKVGQPAQCLAIQGGQAPSTYLLLRKALESGVLPSAIVVDFEPHLLRNVRNDNTRMWAELANLRDTVELAWTERNAHFFAAMAVCRILPSYRKRYEVRDNIMAGLRGETPPMAMLLETAHRNQGMNRGAVILNKVSGPLAHDISNWANPNPTPAPAPWSPDPLNELYARKFFQLALDNGIPVYCALMPVVPELQGKYERNGIDPHYFAWLRGMQATFSNLYVLDWRHSGFPPSVFTDALHLDKDGVASTSVALGDHLRRSFRGEGVGVRWVSMPAFRLEGEAITVEDHSQSDFLMRSRATRRR